MKVVLLERIELSYSAYRAAVGVSRDRLFQQAVRVGRELMKVVLLERIELSTSPLPRECSTSELQQRR